MSTSWVQQRSGEALPEGAIKGGQEANQSDIFQIARAVLSDGSTHPGKFAESSRGALIAFGGAEVYVPDYEILVGSEHAIRWEQRNGTLSDTNNCIEGGRDAEGNVLYVVQVDHEGGTFPGKAGPTLNGANFGYGGQEIASDSYRVLLNA